MLERSAAGAPEGLWLRADRQDDGRGRMGRRWNDGDGNVFASNIIKLQADDNPASQLAFVAAISVRAALAHYAPEIPFLLKWPNDILVNGAKICGILLERKRDAVIFGVGVNLCDHPENLDRPAISLSALGISPPHPQKFVETLADIFAEKLAQWRLAGLGAVTQEWQKFAHPPGTPLTANLPDGEQIQGRYHGLGDDGALKLRLADGSVRAIHAADIFLV